MKLISMLCCVALVAPVTMSAAQADLRSRPERTEYRETSKYSDVLEFIDRLQSVSDVIRVENFGESNEGRPLPLVILSRPALGDPAEAHRSGKPIVFVMANIHAGEVEGKEAALHLMREVVQGPLGKLLDKIILLVAPIYNADGNEKISIANRTAQNGPVGGVGTRENAQRLDLNRDFMKLDSPEARGLLEGVFNRWDPHVTIDLHTTNGSYHGYALTYSPSLNPNTDARIIMLVRDRLLPSVTRILRTRHDYRTYYYGNFADEKNPVRELNPDQSTDPKVWATFDHRPRFGTNYVGLRNRIAILSEAYSYLDFHKRIDVTEKFVGAVLQYVADHSGEVMGAIREADAQSVLKGVTMGNEDGFGVSFELKQSPRPVEILVGSVTSTADPQTSRPRLRATDEARPVKMIEYGEFRAVRRVKPAPAYILKPDQRKQIELLLAHGVIVEALRKDESFEVEQYQVKEINRPERAFQGHRESKLSVSTTAMRESFPAGSFIVSMHQPKAPLIFYLLEPETDDGLANWNYFDAELDRQAGAGGVKVYPVYRLKQLPKAPREIVKVRQAKG